MNAITMSTKVSPFAKEVAQQLLSLGAIEFKVKETVTWASGIVSPLYCDNRKINSNVGVRNFMVEAFIKTIENFYPDVEVIAGVATGGMPLGVLIADRMNLPFIYVRQAPKGHGLKRQVEGDYSPGAKVVLIEDHVSTGGSSLKAVEGLRDAELNMLGLISIMTYAFKKAEFLFYDNDVKYLSLCDLDTIVDVAFREGKITKQDKDSILAFRDNPESWDKTR